MKHKKLGLWILGLILVIATITGASAYSSWSKWGMSSEDDLWGFDDILTMATLENSCEPAGGSAKYGAYVDSQYYKIWTPGTTALQVWDSNCNLLDEESYNGTIEGSPFIWNNVGAGYQHMWVPVETPDTTVSLENWQFNGTALELYTTCDLGTGAHWCSGLWIDQARDLGAIFCDDGIHRVNLDTCAQTIRSSGCTHEYTFEDTNWHVGSRVNRYDPDFDPDEGVTGGDFDNDNDENVLFYSMSSNPGGAAGLDHCIVNYEIGSDTIEGFINYTDRTYFWIVLQETDKIAYGGAMYFAGNMGASNSDWEVYGAHTAKNYGFGSGYSWTVRNHGLTSTLFNWAGSGNGGGRIHPKMSNWMVADVDLDGANEYCGIKSSAYATNNIMIMCWDTDHSMLQNCTLSEYTNYTGFYNIGKPVMATMIEYDTSNSFMEVATVFGIYEFGGEYCNQLYDFGYDDPDTYTGNFIPADINGDNKLDLIYCDNSRCEFFKTAEAGAEDIQCDLPACEDPCIAYDTFPYEINIEYCGWDYLPYYWDWDLRPEAGELCFNPGGVDLLQIWRTAWPGYYASAGTDEFDMQIDNASESLTHALRYYDSTGGDYHNIYTLSWHASGNLTWIQYTYFDEEYGMDTATSLCSGCWDLGVNHNYKIIHYNFDTLGRSFFNQSANASQLIDPQTWGIIIDDTTGYFNLPQHEPLIEGNSNMMEDVKWEWYYGNVCLDNVKVYSGTDFDTWDLTQPDPFNLTQFKCCFQQDTGEFNCLVSGCQDCCESYMGGFRVKSFTCTIGKWFECAVLDEIKDWIFDNIITFILLLLLFILAIPLLLKLYEIRQGHRYM